MTELWLPATGWEGLYDVSDCGAVQRVGGRVLRPWVTREHVHVSLYRLNRKTNRQVHHLVLEAFVGPRPNKMDGCHNDGDPLNNAVENLRWDSRAGNFRDKIAHGTDYQRNKRFCKRGHLLQLPNLVQSLYLRTGYRDCLACNRGSNTWRYYGRRGDLQALVDAHYVKIMVAA